MVLFHEGDTQTQRWSPDSSWPSKLRGTCGTKALGIQLDFWNIKQRSETTRFRAVVCDIRLIIQKGMKCLWVSWLGVQCQHARQHRSLLRSATQAPCCSCALADFRYFLEIPKYDVCQSGHIQLRFCLQASTSWRMTSWWHSHWCPTKPRLFSRQS